MSSAVPRQPRVFFGNLPRFNGQRATQQAKADIVELCRPFGAIHDVVVKTEKGTAFVSFPTLAAAEYAIYRLHSVYSFCTSFILNR